MSKYTKEKILRDYSIACLSREASLLGRKEVLAGKAKFGIFGAGKELSQIAAANASKPGDWRAGYYRDQSFVFATESGTIDQFFSQLYADTNVEHDPFSGGRQMNNHFATKYIDRNSGEWLTQTEGFNNSSDASPTASQMSRALGLAYASKLYRQNPQLSNFDKFSVSGNEVTFATIGNASTSEGVFWECVNAAGVLQVPMVFCIWDDDYGISVHNKYQTVKESISKSLMGMQKEDEGNGINFYHAKGWNYEQLNDIFEQATEEARKTHTPSFVHVTEINQPQGHSTSGSHERYKSDERLEFEKSIDGLTKMRAWILENKFACEDEITNLEVEAKSFVEKQQKIAWDRFQQPILDERAELSAILESHTQNTKVAQMLEVLNRFPTANRKAIATTARKALLTLKSSGEKCDKLLSFVENYKKENAERYNSYLMPVANSALDVSAVAASYSSNPEKVDGRLIINKCFDDILRRDPRTFLIGEDIGQLGGVNLEFDGLQEKYGEIRITDTGIRELTIFGQGLGAAMRGLRPIVDIQYLDYLLYAFQPLSDDLASLHYRTAGSQSAPLIVRTKGHRLEGVWHSGSPMGMILGGSRGIHVCVPRNMVQAAGMYNTLLESDDPALVVEVLNQYRVKEQLPENLTDFKIPLGVPEILETGSDITLVTYGACVHIAKEAVDELTELGIKAELIDVRTLLPFDRYAIIGSSLEKTNCVLFIDEDVPGGASSFMMREVLETQNAYEYLDAKPQSLTAKPHRSPYGSDGDYFTKPSVEDIVEKVYEMMRERNPKRWPAIN